MALIYSNFLPEEPIKVIFTPTLRQEEGHGGGRKKKRWRELKGRRGVGQKEERFKNKITAAAINC